MAEVCETSKLLQVSDDKLKVRRASPWPDQDTSRPRTVFVKGIPPTATLDELLIFFGKFGAVNAVRFCRNEAKERKNSVFVEFADVATADTVTAMTGQEFPETGGSVLHFESAAAYYKRKGPKQATRNRKANSSTTSGSKTERPTVAAGTVVHFANIGTRLSRQALKEVFEEHGTSGSVMSIDYAPGTSEGFVRLTNDIMASFMVEKMEKGQIVVDASVPVLRVLEGKEFDDYVEKIGMLDDIKNAPKRKKQKGKGQNKKAQVTEEKEAVAE